jgi:hypothetical protein
MSSVPTGLTMKYNPKIHHRRSIRLKGHDYTQPGGYFITICTYRRDEIFGEVISGEMKLSPLGRIVEEEWFRSGEIRKEIQLFEDEFVVMSNHLHGINWITDPVGADGIRPNKGMHPNNAGADGIRPNKNTKPRAKNRTHTVRPYCGGRRVRWDRSLQDSRRLSHHELKRN